MVSSKLAAIAKKGGDTDLQRDLRGRRAVVTGASAGIGRAVASALEACGARVMGGARRAERIETEYSAQLDLADAASCERFVESATAQFGGIDILVNCAGIVVDRYPIDWSNDVDERRIFETNLIGLVRVTRLCVPHMDEDGHIVNIGSISSRRAHAGAASYIASKHAIRGFSFALREDLLGRAISVTHVDPGMVETEILLPRYGGDHARVASLYAAANPLRPEDVAACVVFVLSRPPTVNVNELVVEPRGQAWGRQAAE